MKENTYTICYTPSNIRRDHELKYTCYDGKVHVRLNDFTGRHIISGFESKLSYLLTCLLKGKTKTIKNKSPDAIIAKYCSSSNEVFLIIEESIKDVLGSDFKGIKVLKNYKKSEAYNPLGSVLDDYMLGIEYDNIGVGEFGYLTTFLSILPAGFTINDYLFNDSLTIILGKNMFAKEQTKLINKKIREDIKIEKSENPDLVKLW